MPDFVKILIEEYLYNFFNFQHFFIFKERGSKTAFKKINAILE